MVFICVTNLGSLVHECRSKGVVFVDGCDQAHAEAAYCAPHVVINGVIVLFPVQTTSHNLIGMSLQGKTS